MDIANNKRFQLLELRDGEVADFKNYKLVPALEKEIPRDTFTVSLCCSKDWAIWTEIKIWCEHGCPGRVRSSWSTSGTRCVTLVTNTVMCPGWVNALTVHLF